MQKVHGAITVRQARLVLVTFATGVTLGLEGMALALLLRLAQHVAYGHGPHTLAGQQSFLWEVTMASDSRRFLALCSCGAVAGIGWWLLYRFGTRYFPGTMNPCAVCAIRRSIFGPSARERVSSQTQRQSLPHRSWHLNTGGRTTTTPQIS